MSRRLVIFAFVSAGIIAIEWAWFIFHSSRNLIEMGRDVEPTGLFTFMALRTGLFALAAVVPMVLFVAWRVGTDGIVANTIVLASIMVALQFAIRHIWRLAIPDSEIRARTMELEYGPLWLALTTIPVFCNLALKKPFRHTYRGWIDVVVTIGLALVAIVLSSRI